MKYKLIFLLVIAVVFTACSSKSQEIKEHDEFSDDIDYDLTQMSETMVYSQIFDLVSTPFEYEDARFVIEGNLIESEDLNTGEIFYAIFIEDAAACCSQGLEVVFTQDFEIPTLPKSVVLTGTIKSYSYNDYDYAFVVAEDIADIEVLEE